MSSDTTEGIEVMEQPEHDAQPKQGDVTFLKVTYGRPTAFSDDQGRRLVQVTVFQPFAPDIVALVREDSIVTAPAGTKMDFAVD